MPTWKELFAKIETEEQARAVHETLLKAADKFHTDLAAQKRALVKEDMLQHPDEYPDLFKDGKAYEGEKLDKKINSMILDHKPEKFFNHEDSSKIGMADYFIQNLSILKSTFDDKEAPPEQLCFMNGKTTGYFVPACEQYFFKNFGDIEEDYVKEMFDGFMQEAVDKLNSMPPAMNAEDVQTFSNLMSPAMELGEYFEELAPVAEKIAMDVNGKVATSLISNDARDTKPKIATKEFDTECKNLAADIYDKVENAKNKVVVDPDLPGAGNFQMEILDFMQLEADALKNGIHLSDPSAINQGFRLMSTLMPQLGFNNFKPENKQAVDEALKEYPLDKLAHLCNEMQKKQNEYSKNSLNMSEAEKEEYKNWMNHKNLELLELSQNLYEKSLNPSEKTISLFGKADLLTNQNTGFIGNRGLRATIDTINEQFFKPSIPAEQVNAWDDALDNFTTKRSFVFKSESDEHVAVREAAEKVLENMQKLQAGVYTDRDGKVRPLGLEEKEALINETVDKLNTLSTTTQDYIDHATKNGTKIPGTPAGKTRLEGAESMKNLIQGLQDTLSREQEKDYKISKDHFVDQNVKKASKEEGRKSLNVNSLVKQEELANPKPERRNSVHIPNKRPQIDGPAKNANVQGGKAK